MLKEYLNYPNVRARQVKARFRDIENNIDEPIEGLNIYFVYDTVCNTALAED
jgi:hypothetical protein